jgi:NADPH2:quinone reductase
VPSGNEFAGHIAAVGPGVSGWREGDRVMGRGRACQADYTLTPAAALMAIPNGLADEEAAAIPNVFVTAHDAIVTAAQAGEDDAVLITAGSSGVGTAAIQIARYLGCRSVLATTTSSAKAEALRSLGAVHVIDTSQEGWPTAITEAAGPVNAVIDQVGGGLFPGLLKAMALKGRYVSVGRNDGAHASIDLDLVARQRLHLIGVTFRTRSAEETLACSQRFAADLLPGFDSGALKPVLDRAFPLEQLPDAHAYMLSNAQFGKIVLTP